MPQFPLAIDWFQVEGVEGGAPSIHLHVQEIDTGWKQEEAEWTAWLVAVCDSLCAACSVPAEALHLKRRERQRGRAQYGKSGEEPHRHVVREGAFRFEVDFDTYVDTGLFLDQRLNRARIAERARGARFLNLFGYTGSFSVYAAGGGAVASDTVDLSNTYLAWTARNFALNAIDPTRHRLFRADVLTWLEGALREGRRYELIVLDPPSFSNSKKMHGVLDIQRDHRRLIGQCVQVLAPGGTLLFSTNLRTFTLDADLSQRLPIREITGESVPEDFLRAGRRPPHRAFLIGT